MLRNWLNLRPFLGPQLFFALSKIFKWEVAAAAMVRQRAFLDAFRSTEQIMNFFAGFVYEFWKFWFFAPIIIGSKNKVNLGTISCVRTIKCYFFGCLTRLNFYWFTFDKPWNELRDILTAFRIGSMTKCLVFMAKNLMFVS